MTIRILESPSSDLIRFLENCEYTMLYNSIGYLSLISQHLSSEMFWFVNYKKDGKISCALPVMTKDGQFGKVVNSLPFYGSNGGIFEQESNVSSKKNLLDFFYDYCLKISAASITLVSNPFNSMKEFYDDWAHYDFIDMRIGQITNFPINKDISLIDTFSDPRPRNIRRAIKEGIIIEKDWEKNIDFLHSVHLENMNSIGGKPKKKEFFTQIPKYMKKEEWSIFTAKKNSATVAALLLFYHNKTVEYFTPVIKKQYRSTQALSYIIYSAMIEARENGFLNWNWGGTWSSQSGVYDFKKKWGTNDNYYYYYTKVLNKELLKSTVEFLENEYYGFYTIPYNMLNLSKEEL